MGRPLKEMAEFEREARERLARGPEIPASAFVAPSATVVGRVVLGERVGVWYGAVLRGDVDSVLVGEETNVQDGAVLHTADGFPCRLGARCTVGHRAVVHGCAVADECLVGMGAVLLDGCEVGPRCIIGAKALLTQGMRVPEGSLVVGAPARVVRPITAEERGKLLGWAARYVALARLHREAALRAAR
jgi:carbonic anhydrase/acetyltransferase-like protein (isoleucine patch superfamily)